MARWPFWLCVDDARAGFALLRRDAAGMQMAEFFVTRSCRRRGIGVGAARRLIARFPGRWRITQREGNAAAIAFWHRVLDGFVAYEELTTRDQRRAARAAFHLRPSVMPGQPDPLKRTSDVSVLRGHPVRITTLF